MRWSGAEPVLEGYAEALLPALEDLARQQVAHRFAQQPLAHAAAQLKPRSCLIDGEVVRYDAGDIERALATVPRNQNSGLIVIARALGLFVTAGSLISYGPDAIEMTYRIVRSAPGDRQ